jgi:hypothetical protein
MLSSLLCAKLVLQSAAKTLVAVNWVKFAVFPTGVYFDDLTLTKMRIIPIK